MQLDIDFYKPPPCSVFVLKKQKGNVNRKQTDTEKPFLQRNYYRGREIKRNERWVACQSEKPLNSPELARFLDNASQNKFNSSEWIDRWLSKIEKPYDFIYDRMDDSGSISSGIEEDWSSEVVWHGQWGSRVQEKEEEHQESDLPWQKREKTIPKQMGQRQLSLCSTNECSSGNCNSSGNRECSRESVDSCDNEVFNVECLLTEPTTETFVTLSCDNIAKKGDNYCIDKRHIAVCHLKNKQNN